MLRVRHLNPEPVFRTGGLSIRGVGVRELMPPCSISRPSTGDYLLMLFHDGVRIGRPGQDVRGRVASLVVWRPGEWQAYGNPVHAWCHSWIHCSGAFVSRTLSDAATPFSTPIAVDDPSAVDRYLLAIHDEVFTGPSADAAIVRAAFVLLVRVATRAARGSVPRRPPPEELIRSMDVINERYHEPLRLADLAAAAGLSVPHFVGRFHECFGAPPIAYLNRRRMEVACALLKDTSESVASIGRRVGYPDSAHFSKAFRAQVGVPPTYLRRAATGTR